jgi:histidinol-phosphatase (PHP family)
MEQLLHGNKLIGGILMFDSHLHTKYSYDSTMTIEDAIKRAEKLSLGLIITDHMDILNEKSLDNTGKKGSVFDMEKYFEEYSPYRNDKLLLGVELGLIPNMVVLNKKLVNKFPLDYVLGSIHMVGKKGIGSENFFSGKSKKAVFEEYLECIIENLWHYNFIDSLGHIDFISRYAQYVDKEIRHKDYAVFLDEIFMLLNVNEIALEINAKRLEDKLAAQNMYHLYQRYKELGGKYVTLGSDSHTTEYIGRNIHIAEKLAESCELRIVYFKDRKLCYA